MNKIFCLIFLINFSAKAQTHISGKILDNKNNPLPGISITLKNTYDGTTTDSLGNYSFITIEKGEQILEASATGYRPFGQKINLSGTPVKINITLKELVTELKAVVISAGAFEASDQKRTTVLNPIDIVTTASANADITAAIKTLPGTQQVGETEGLFVRGGTAAESKTFIDGTLVNNFYYSSQPGLAQRGRFNPFIFKGTIFSAGGYSALYGQALSSALILESIDMPERSSADLAISYLSVGGGLQQLAKNKKSSWGISYNYTDLRLAFKLVKQKQDYFNVPVLHSADANFRIKTSKTGIVKYYGTLSTTKAGFRYSDIDSTGMKNAFRLNNFNMYHNLSWREKIGNKLKLTTGFSYSTNKDDISNEFENQNNQKQSIINPIFFAFKNFGVVTHGNYVNAKVVIERKLKGLSAFRFGSEYNYSNDKTDFTLYNGNKFTDAVKENILSGFAETDIYITNDIAAKIGTRAEHSSLLNKWNIAPRLSLAYKFTDNSQASFAYGIFYQDPEKRYLPATVNLDFAKATHYIAQYQKLSNSRTFRAEVFYKKYEDLFKTANNTGQETIISNKGYGDAKGVEFFWRDKKTIKNVDYWISYSYLDTKRDFLNYPSLIEPLFAAKHTASLVVKKFVTKLKTQFNASYTYATGRPYYNIRYDNTTNTNKIFDAGRTKDFNSLSFSINYLPNIGQAKAKRFSVVVFSVSNVLGSNNIYSYNYSYNGINKQAVTPPSKRFYYLGWFISFGIDRTEDKINLTL
ncbi:MAG TPA: TonB-dependent receptor [Chitinophagaceae bacterium]|nr:TonB-dependent receptor [Chitinophagaceae bacterium]